MNITNNRPSAATATPVSVTTPSPDGSRDRFDASAPTRVVELPDPRTATGAGIIDGATDLVRETGLDPFTGIGRSVAELIMLLLVTVTRRADDGIRAKIDEIGGAQESELSEAADVKIVELKRALDMRKTVFDALSNAVQERDRSAKQQAAEIGQR